MVKWDFENCKQLELKLDDPREEWEKNGFKTREEWLKACAFDKEFKYLEKRNKNHFSYLDPTASNS